MKAIRKIIGLVVVLAMLVLGVTACSTGAPDEWQAVTATEVHRP